MIRNPIAYEAAVARRKAEANNRKRNAANALRNLRGQRGYNSDIAKMERALRRMPEGAARNILKRVARKASIGQRALFRAAWTSITPSGERAAKAYAAIRQGPSATYEVGGETRRVGRLGGNFNWRWIPNTVRKAIAKATVNFADIKAGRLRWGAGVKYTRTRLSRLSPLLNGKFRVLDRVKLIHTPQEMLRKLGEAVRHTFNEECRKEALKVKQ